MMDHELYDGEAKVHPKLRCLADIPPISPVERVRIECAYRRGYQQGFYRALNSLERGFSFERCMKFMGKTLYHWRYAKHNGRFTDPPVLGEGKNK